MDSPGTPDRDADAPVDVHASPRNLCIDTVANLSTSPKTATPLDAEQIGATSVNVGTNGSVPFGIAGRAEPTAT
jgi:hypothetical protein